MVDLSLSASEQKFKEVLAVLEVQQVYRWESNLAIFHQIKWHLMNHIWVEVIVEDFVTRQHEAVKSLLVHEHFLEFNALISHTLVVRCAIGCLSNALGLNLGLDQEIVSLRVDPNAVVLHYNLLKDTLLERLPEFYGFQSEGIM